MLSIAQGLKYMVCIQKVKSWAFPIKRSLLADVGKDQNSPRDQPTAQLSIWHVYIRWKSGLGLIFSWRPIRRTGKSLWNYFPCLLGPEGCKMNGAGSLNSLCTEMLFKWSSLLIIINITQELWPSASCQRLRKFIMLLLVTMDYVWQRQAVQQPDCAERKPLHQGDSCTQGE